MGLDQGSLRDHSGGARNLNFEGTNERFHGFTEFRGKPAGRGRDGRASANQVTAGVSQEHVTVVCHTVGVSRIDACLRCCTGACDACHIGCLGAVCLAHVLQVQTQFIIPELKSTFTAA